MSVKQKLPEVFIIGGAAGPYVKNLNSAVMMASKMSMSIPSTSSNRSAAPHEPSPADVNQHDPSGITLVATSVIAASHHDTRYHCPGQLKV